MPMAWRTKSVEQSIADTDEPGTRLRKDLTWWDLMVFGVSVVIGAGIFTITASTAGSIAGPAISISFVIAAVACGLAALCYAEFASTVPVAGSAYTFSYASFGELVAWIIGWDLVLEFAVGAATVAKSWSTYLGQGVRLRRRNGATRSAGTRLGRGHHRRDRHHAARPRHQVVVALFRRHHADQGRRGAGRHRRRRLLHQGVELFAVHSADGERAADRANQSLFSLLSGAGSSNYGWYGLLAGASVVFFAFIGFDVVATTAEETKEPQRDVPRGIFGHAGHRHRALCRGGGGAVGNGQVHRVEEGRCRTPTSRRRSTSTASTGRPRSSASAALAGLTTVVMVMLLGPDPGVVRHVRGTGRCRASWPTGARDPGAAHRHRRRLVAAAGGVSRSATSRRWSTSARCSRSCWSASA